MTNITELREALKQELESMPADQLPPPDELIRRATRAHRAGRTARFAEITAVSLLVVAGIGFSLKTMWPLARDAGRPAAPPAPASATSPAAAATVALGLTFDGKTCTYAGPRELVADGAWIDVTALSTEGKKVDWYLWWLAPGTTRREAMHLEGRWSDPGSPLVRGFMYGWSGDGIGGDNPWTRIEKGQRLVIGCVGQAREVYPAAFVRVLGPQ